MKKIWISLLLVFTTLSVGISFADVISPGTHRVDRCIRFKNVEIDNYRLVVENYGPMTDKIYEPKIGECLHGHYHAGKSRQYLLDKSVNIEEITHKNIQDKAILIGNLRIPGGYIDDGNPLTNETITYKIVKDGDSYTLKMSGAKAGLDDNRFIKFGIAWVITVLIETIILFLIAKLFRRKSQIPNSRILSIGVIASTVTLPLLWFILPLFIEHAREYTIIGEPLAIFIEIFIIKYGLKVSRGKAIFASILCNLCSYLSGIFVFQLLH